jgi:hypothetical protein
MWCITFINRPVLLSDLSRVNRAVLFRNDVMWGSRLEASFWWGLFHYYFLETTTILSAILFYSTNQQLQLHFTNQLYTTIPNKTPHNTAIMPRQFFVGGNFKM